MGILGQYDFAHRMDLSRRLMPNIISLLKDCGLEMKDVEAIGVSLGPGSFTGLRIGVVTAKTLAQVLGVPISGIVSLDLLAHQFDYLAQAVVCPLIKVRRAEVYYAFFRADRGSIQRISDYDAGPIEKVIQFAKDSPPLPRLGEGMEVRAGLSEVIFCGDALLENLDALRQALGNVVVPAPPWLSYPKASILAQSALENVTQGKADDPLSLAPFYIRRSAPEMRLETASNACRRNAKRSAG